VTSSGERADDPLAGKHCLVLGAGGFIGGHVCCELRRRGARVHGFGRRQSYPEALDGIRFTTAQFSDRATVARAVEGAEYVFHLLAGSTPESSNRDPAADLESGVLATLHLLSICRSVGVRKVVFVSSGGTVYGIPTSIPIHEDAPTNPICAYGVSRLAIEKYLHLYWHLHGLDYAVLRVANPFGPWQDPERRQGVVPALMHAVMQQRSAEIWGDGHVVRDYVYAGDVAEAVALVANYSGEQRVFNVGSGIGRSILDVMSDITAVLGGLAARTIHKPARASDVPVNVLHTALIRREVGWVARTDWVTGLKLTAAWLRHGNRPRTGRRSTTMAPTRPM
jgi:UDP-glucose 4-epimerase